MILPHDDGIVVAMGERMTVDSYFELPETLKPMELVRGFVREPPSPNYGHQSLVTHLTALLKNHVDRKRLGIVCVSPMDVVLDRNLPLVVQPDVIFVSTGRADIIRDRIWGAPDLVVEVLSPRTARRDRTTKLGWYRRYGVKECWLVDPKRRMVEVVTPAGARTGRRTFSRNQRVESRVLPAFEASAGRLFEV